jgi:CubicO group peptidase (beta-lactamase class C family)
MLIPPTILILLSLVLSLSDIAGAEIRLQQTLDWGFRAATVVDSHTPGLMVEYKVPGVSIALIDNNRIVRTATYGVANAKTKSPVATNTLFEAASMSKPLFAYAALKLVETGNLDLDRPLTAYLEEAYLPDQPQHRRITARMVLSHTSGFPNWRKGGWRSGNALAVKFEPGSRFGYSGEGFLFLQRAVENITGEPLDLFMSRRLLPHLGMQTSSYQWEPKNSPLIAAGHHLDGKVKTANRRYDAPNAAYSLFTTPTEYARFLIEMMRDDRSAKHSLSKATLTAMLTPVSHDQENGRHYGLGWAIKQRPTGNLYSHGGSNGSGFRCYSRFDPKTKTGIVIMTNGIGGAELHRALLKRIDRAIELLRPPDAHSNQTTDR